jgi:hypothetical protein
LETYDDDLKNRQGHIDKNEMSTTSAQSSTTAETGSNKSKDSRGTSGVNKSFKSASSAAANYRIETTGIEEMRGYIFTYGTQGQQSNYIRAKKALADYVGTKFRFAKELYKAINGEEEVELVEPQPPASNKPTQVEMKRYEVLCNSTFPRWKSMRERGPSCSG